MNSELDVSLRNSISEMSNMKIMKQRVIAARKDVLEKTLLLWFCGCSLYIDFDALNALSYFPKSWPGRDAALCSTLLRRGVAFEQLPGLPGVGVVGRGPTSSPSLGPLIIVRIRSYKDSEYELISHDRNCRDVSGKPRNRHTGICTEQFL